MMQIEILFFGITADIATTKSTFIDIKTGSSIADLRNALIQLYPQLTTFKKYAIALNMEYVEDDIIIQSNDIIALIPPVSGG